MCEELKKMGADIEELSDGLIIKNSKLNAANLSGHYDHRVVMALAVAGMGVDGTTTVDTAEAVSITFPNFIKLMQDLGANVQSDEDFEY
jgi:3-phosphoshikimate 1-carboxyvinyltransferase